MNSAHPTGKVVRCWRQRSASARRAGSQQSPGCVESRGSRVPMVHCVRGARCRFGAPRAELRRSTWRLPLEADRRYGVDLDRPEDWSSRPARRSAFLRIARMGGRVHGEQGGVGGWIGRRGGEGIVGECFEEGDERLLVAVGQSEAGGGMFPRFGSSVSVRFTSLL